METQLESTVERVLDRAGGTRHDAVAARSRTLKSKRDAVPSDRPMSAAEGERLELLRPARTRLVDWDLLSNQVHYFTRFRELLGYTAEEPFSRSQLLFHPDDAERMKRAIAPPARDRVSIEEDFRLRCKTASTGGSAVTVTALRDDLGRPLRVQDR